MPDLDRPIGQNVVDRISPRMRKLLGMSVAGLTITTVAIIGYNQSRSTPATAAVDPTAATIIVPADACADPDTYQAVQDALAQTSESTANALLALPSEVAAKDRAAQEQAWRELDDYTRAFQLCLRLTQDQSEPNR